MGAWWTSCSRTSARGTIRLYLDASALTKALIVSEPGHEHATRLWNEAVELTTAEVTYAEVRAALARARRAGRLGRAGLGRAKDDLERAWQQVVPLVVDWSLVREAGDLAEDFALRAYDAVHLAAAIAVADVDVLVATWDADLANAARAAGLSVAP